MLGEIASEQRARVAVKSYHGAGKTFGAALVVNWFFFTRIQAHILTTAPTEQQVKDHLWGEITKQVHHSVFAEAMSGHIYTMRMEMPGYAKYWYAQGRVSNRPVNIEGMHGPHVLYVIDEAKGVPYSIFEAIEGALTNEEGDVRVLMISTPALRKSGYFYDAFKTKKMEGLYKPVNVGLDESSRVSQKWRDARKKEWGEKSPVYQARVLGEFPDEAAGTLIRPEWVDDAIGREIPKGSVVVVSADVARYGEDNTVLFTRWGDVLSDPTQYPKQDTMTTATMIRMRCLTVMANMVKVDDSGLGGGVVDRLIQLKSENNDPWDIEGVDSGSAASNPQRFLNRRAELAWVLRKRFEEGKISIPDHGTLIADLLAYKYHYNRKDQMVLDSKEEMKTEIGRSPDYGDAAILCFAINTKTITPRIYMWNQEVERVVSV